MEKIKFTIVSPSNIKDIESGKLVFEKENIISQKTTNNNKNHFFPYNFSTTFTSIANIKIYYHSNSTFYYITNGSYVYKTTKDNAFYNLMFNSENITEESLRVGLKAIIDGHDTWTSEDI